MEAQRAVDIEAHRDLPEHAARCAWRRAADFGIDLSLLRESGRASRAERLGVLERGARFQSKAWRTMELFNVESLLDTLVAHCVDFVVVGGVAATLHGSSYITRDLDVCYSRVPENLERIVDALQSLHPRLRVHGMPVDEAQELPFRLDVSHIARGVNFTLATDDGPLDLLGEVKGIGDFDAVLGQSESQEVAGLQLQVLGLPALILAKQAAGRPKDLLLVPELEALLELRRTEESAEPPRD